MTPEEERQLEILRQRKAAYQQVFNTPIGAQVLLDLIPFMHAKRTTNVLGEKHMIWIYEGRRQVWLRIEDHLTRTPEELFKLYRPDPNQEGTISHG